MTDKLHAPADLPPRKAPAVPTECEGRVTPDSVWKLWITQTTFPESYRRKVSESFNP